MNIPIDINQNKIIVSKPQEMRPLSIAIYNGEGSTEVGVKNVSQNILSTINAHITELDPASFSNDLSAFNVVIFSGGSGSKQGLATGETGRENIRNYINNGGNYLGICAGAYLATSGFDWSLKILNAETISTTEWQRGEAFLDLEITEDGKTIFGDLGRMFKCRYNSGPLLKPMNLQGIPAYTVAAYFRSEISDNGVTPGVMINTPAAVFANYGKGKIFVISSHPENTPGLENFIPKVLEWMIRDNK